MPLSRVHHPPINAASNNISCLLYMWVKNALEAVNPDIVRKSICISRIDLNPDGSEDDKISGNREDCVAAGAKEEIG